MDVATLQTYLTEAQTARHQLALGDKTVEIWRDGRRLTYSKTSLKELDAYIMKLKQEIADAQLAESGGSIDGYTSTRRPIVPVY